MTRAFDLRSSLDWPKHPSLLTVSCDIDNCLCILTTTDTDNDHRHPPMKPLLLSLPDALADWRGTAAELADKCNEVLGEVPTLSDDAGAANERLVRHYVQVGVLSPPDREGREALFGLRQIVEFLATRYLLKDGWPLAKAAELVRETDVAGLTQLIPSDRPRTRAEEVVAKYRGVHASPDGKLSQPRPPCRSLSVAVTQGPADQMLTLSASQPPPRSAERPASSSVR